MPRYILLTRATETGSRDIITWGTEGTKGYAAHVKQAHGKLIAQHVVSGHYDLVSVVDFEDDAGCLAFSLYSQSGGLYVEALRAYSESEIHRACSRMPQIVEQRKEMLKAERQAKNRKKKRPNKE